MQKLGLLRILRTVQCSCESVRIVRSLPAKPDQERICSDGCRESDNAVGLLNAGGADGPMTEWVVGATGMPIPPALSGFRIVTVDGHKLDSRWYCLAALPNQIDPLKLPATTCAQ